MTKIVNLATHRCTGAVRVDRTTCFGNPFVIYRDGSREEVLEKFESYAMDRFLTDPVWREKVRGLKGKKLACWCAPLACHAEILAKLSHR